MPLWLVALGVSFCWHRVPLLQSIVATWPHLLSIQQRSRRSQPPLDCSWPSHIGCGQWQTPLPSGPCTGPPASETCHISHPKWLCLCQLHSCHPDKLVQLVWILFHSTRTVTFHFHAPVPHTQQLPLLSWCSCRSGFPFLQCAHALSGSLVLFHLPLHWQSLLVSSLFCQSASCCMCSTHPQPFSELLHPSFGQTCCQGVQK